MAADDSDAIQSNTDLVPQRRDDLNSALVFSGTNNKVNNTKASKNKNEITIH